MNNAFKILIIVIVLVGISSIVLSLVGFWDKKDRANTTTWYGERRPEVEECFKYGGGWVSDKNGETYCDKGHGSPFNSNGSCPEGYVKVKNALNYFKDDGYYSCMEKEYVESANCEKYWEIIWSNQGYGCSRLSNEEIILQQNEEIIKNQETILGLLERQE